LEHITNKKQAKLSVILEKYNDYHGEVNEIKYETRLQQNQQLINPKYVSSFDERTFKNILPKIWNEMPKKIKNLKIIKQ
jgi:hypothetical protein